MVLRVKNFLNLKKKKKKGQGEKWKKKENFLVQEKKKITKILLPFKSVRTLNIYVVTYYFSLNSV